MPLRKVNELLCLSTQYTSRKDNSCELAVTMLPIELSSHLLMIQQICKSGLQHRKRTFHPVLANRLLGNPNFGLSAQDNILKTVQVGLQLFVPFAVSFQAMPARLHFQVYFLDSFITNREYDIKIICVIWNGELKKSACVASWLITIHKP